MNTVPGCGKNRF